MKVNRYIVFTGMGFELVGIIISGAFLGKKIDETYQLNGLGTLGLTIGGLFGWIFHLVILAKRIDKAEELETAPKDEQDVK